MGKRSWREEKEGRREGSKREGRRWEGEGGMKWGESQRKGWMEGGKRGERRWGNGLG